MPSWLSIGIAGMLGVLARHTVQQLVPRHGSLPWGTLIVNVSGALLIGFLAGFVAHRLSLPMWLHEAVTVGLDVHDDHVRAGGPWCWVCRGLRCRLRPLQRVRVRIGCMDLRGRRGDLVLGCDPPVHRNQSA